jgi:hypothetical protein
VEAHGNRPTEAQARQLAAHDQQAGVINNIARDQYNQHSLRIDPMRRRARNVMRAGFTLIFAGFAAAVVGFAMFAGSINEGFSHPNAQPNLTGWAILGAGSAMMTLGVLVVITSLFMKRGVRREERQP